jgi:hypothetical protein
MRKAALNEALPGFFALIVMPVLGFLFCATIIHQFAAVYGPDAQVRGTYAVAKECNRHGPVSTRGLGFWYRCMAEIYRYSPGDSARGPDSVEPVDYLGAEDIGHQVPIKLVEARGVNPWVRAADQPLKEWGWLALPFGLLWLLLTGFLARNALRNVKSTPDDGNEVLIMGKRKQWVDWRLRGMVLLGVVAGAFESTEWAFQGYRAQTNIAVTSYALILLIVGNSLRRGIFAPHVTVTPTGLKFGRNRSLAWHEIRHVGLSRRGVLSIHPHVGEVVTIGRFGDEQVGSIDAALRDKREISYAREVKGAIMAG